MQLFTQAAQHHKLLTTWNSPVITLYSNYSNNVLKNFRDVLRSFSKNLLSLHNTPILLKCFS